MCCNLSVAMVHVADLTVERCVDVRASRLRPYYRVRLYVEGMLATASPQEAERLRGAVQGHQVWSLSWLANAPAVCVCSDNDIFLSTLGQMCVAVQRALVTIALLA